MHTAARILRRLILLSLILAIHTTPAGAQDILELELRRIPLGLPLDPNVNRPPITFLPARREPPRSDSLVTWKSMRDAGVVRQAFDYSCGAAALATLLGAGGDDASELDVLRTVFAEMDDEEKARTMAEGLTLLDLRRAAVSRGHEAEGYRVEPEILPRLDRPAIVYVEPYGYRHFAVLRGIEGNRVFLADPARGNVRMPIWRFMDMWRDPSTGKGVIFLVAGGADSDLALPENVDPRPEILSARQLIRLGIPSFRPADAPVRNLP